MMAGSLLEATAPAVLWATCIAVSFGCALMSRRPYRRRAARELLRWLLGARGRR